MISIITAIQNQLEMNKIFLDSLRKYSHNPFELIIIDNASNDGSSDFFKENGAIVIHNEANYSYPYCQNQGIRKATGDILVFLNNDLIVSPGWDTHLLHVIGKNNYHAVSFSSNDRGMTFKETKQREHRWIRIKHPLLYLFGNSRTTLSLMFRLMYPNWEKYTQKVFDTYQYQMSEGFSGSAIALTRASLEKIGWWDESQQGADFDLYARVLQRHLSVGDIQPLCIIGGIYIHHYGKLTIKAHRKSTLFADHRNLSSMDVKWGKDNFQAIVKRFEQR